MKLDELKCFPDETCKADEIKLCADSLCKCLQNECTEGQLPNCDYDSGECTCEDDNVVCDAPKVKLCSGDGEPCECVD